MRTRLWWCITLLSVALVACGSPAASTAMPQAGMRSQEPGPGSTQTGVDPAPSAVPSDAGPTIPPPTDSPPAPAATEAPVAEVPGWMSTPLQDVKTGESFTLADFPGKVVIVEGMAVWCTNCRVQQNVVKDVLPKFGDEVVMISLDVDLNETPDLLSAYADRQGFPWRFAVASPELAQALATEFGNAFLSPPSVPMLFIDVQGRPHLADFGHKSMERIEALIRDHLQ